MDEPRVAKTQGLDLVLTPQRDGRVKAELLDDVGNIIQAGNYKNESSAQSSMTTWIKRHYQVEGVISKPKPKPPPKPKPRPLGPGTAQMLEMMDARADDNDAKAISLRQEAESLEMEAKRLRSALEVLKEGNGL
jgi:hypothetical protein